MITIGNNTKIKNCIIGTSKKEKQLEKQVKVLEKLLETQAKEMSIVWIEREDFRDKINKAIEYIEKVIKQNKAFYGEQLEINEFNYLLDILKGSDSNE